jgi:hypothetical protein
MIKLLDFEDPVSRARLLRYFWYISLAMMVLGFITIAIFWDTGI